MNPYYQLLYVFRYKAVEPEGKTIWEQTARQDFGVDVEQVWNQFKPRRNKEVRIKSIGYTPEKSEKKLVHIFLAATVILVAFSTGFFVRHHIDTTERIASEQRSNNFDVLQELKMEKGEKASVTFSDAIQVTLKLRQQYPVSPRVLRFHTGSLSGRGNLETM